MKKFEISGSEKGILVDPGDGFAMGNGESKPEPSGEENTFFFYSRRIYSKIAIIYNINLSDPRMI